MHVHTRACTWEWTWQCTWGDQRLPSPFLEWQLHSPPCLETRSLASVAHCQLLQILCLPLLSPGQRGLTSECFPAHLTCLASSLELESSGLPASAFTYLLSRLPGPPCVIFVFLWGTCGWGDKNCIFNRYCGVWGISSHLNMPVSSKHACERVPQSWQSMELCKPSPHWNLWNLLFLNEHKFAVAV